MSCHGLVATRRTRRGTRARPAVRCHGADGRVSLRSALRRVPLHRAWIMCRRSPIWLLALVAFSPAAGWAQLPGTTAAAGPLSVSVHFLAGLAGVDADLEGAMAAQSFAETYIPSLSGAPLDHPRSDGAGFAWAVGAAYRWRAPLDVGVTYASEMQLGAATGFRAPGLFVGAAAHASTLAATLGVDLGVGRVAAGPAWYRLRYEVSGNRTAEETASEVGFLGEAALRLPLAAGRLFTDLFGQYRWAPDGVVGPAQVGASQGSQTAAFAATTVGLAHLVVGVGLRLSM